MKGWLRTQPLCTVAGDDMNDPIPPRPSRPRHWWVTEKLIVEFPDVPASEVLAAVLDAWRSVEVFGLSHQAESVMAEKLAAEQLAQRHGTSAGDAERHSGPQREPGQE